MIMPFGKYKDRTIVSLPSWYLKWVAENIKEDNQRDSAVCAAADKEYQFREGNNCHIE